MRGSAIVGSDSDTRNCKLKELMPQIIRNIWSPARSSQIFAVSYSDSSDLSGLKGHERLAYARILTEFHIFHQKQFSCAH